MNLARLPAPVLDLLRRLKAIEHADGSWPGSEVINAVNAWFHEHGVAPDIPAEQLPTEDTPHRYTRTVTVVCESWIPLDPDDLDNAIRTAITGTAVRVEPCDSTEVEWVDLAAVEVTPQPDLAP